MREKRLVKVNELIKVAMGEIVKNEVEFQDAFVTVTHVDTSHTMEHTKVFISVIPDDKSDAVIKKLIKNVYPMQQALNKKMHMRVVPKIRFEIDHAGENAARIEKLLEQDKSDITE